MADALIVGGGLAGSAAAILLARAGRSVHLIERETAPHHTACGEFLSIEACEHLVALGLDPVDLGASRIDTIEVAANDRLATAPLPFTARGLSRFRLDEALIERAASAGARVERGVRVTGIEHGGARTASGLAQGANLLLATGKHRVPGSEPVRPPGTDPYLGFKMHYRLSSAASEMLDGRIRLILFDGGYAGVQMIEDGRTNLSLVIRKQELARRGGTWEAVRRMLAALPHCGPLLSDAEPLLSRPVAVANLPYGNRVRQSADEAFFRLGDQAGMTASLTGDGMAAALRSAFIAAQCITEGAEARDYRARHQRVIGHQVRRAMVLQSMQESTILRAAAMATMRVWPGLLTHAALATRLGRWP